MREEDRLSVDEEGLGLEEVSEEEVEERSLPLEEDEEEDLGAISL